MIYLIRKILLPKHLRARNGFRRFLNLVALALLLTTCATEIRAYDDDTHFWLTYYLAVKVGYTPLQSQQIASANISVDYDDHTEPLFPNTIHRQDILKRFHAFPSTKLINTLRDELTSRKKLTCKDVLTNELDELVQCLLREQELRLWEAAKAAGNPGVYLHFYQDRFSHRGFSTRLGHLRLYHLPDFLASDEAKAEEMALGTIEKLQQFISQCPLQGSQPKQPDIQQVMLIVKRIIQANPNARLADHYTEDWRKWDPRFIPLSLPWTNRFQDRPDVSLARMIIVSELAHEVPEISSTTPTIVLYDLNVEGEPSQVWSVGKLIEQEQSAKNRKVIRLLEPQVTQRATKLQLGSWPDSTNVGIEQRG